MEEEEKNKNKNKKKKKKKKKNFMPVYFSKSRLVSDTFKDTSFDNVLDWD
jgi:hypothetical protein